MAGYALTGYPPDLKGKHLDSVKNQDQYGVTCSQCAAKRVKGCGELWCSIYLRNSTTTMTPIVNADRFCSLTCAQTFARSHSTLSISGVNGYVTYNAEKCETCKGNGTQPCSHGKFERTFLL